MDLQAIKELVNDFSLWKGDTFRLAAMIAAEQRERDVARLEAAGHTDAAEFLRHC